MKAEFILVILMLMALSNVYAEQDYVPFKAAEQSLLIMPTAYTMPKGRGSFTDYELFIIQYTYAATNRTHISAAMVFPLHAEMFKTFTIGVKQNYFQEGMLQSAGYLIFNPETHGGMFGNVVSFGTDKASLHASLAWVTDLSEISKDYAVMLGGVVSLSPDFALMSEVLSTSSVLDEEGNGLFCFGIRFKGGKTSWDLGGARLLKGNYDLLFFPILKATIMF